MNITDFFRDAPVLATLITLGYAAVVGVLVFVFIKMYRN